MRQSRPLNRTAALPCRFQAALKARASGTETKWDGPAPPAHLQRKITRKVKFSEKVASNQPLKVAAGSVQKKTSKKRRKPLPDLSSLTGTLDEVLDQRKQKVAAKAGGRDPRQGSGVNTSKIRTIIQAKETERLKQVLAHPQFKADPFSAVMNHLNATLPPPPPKPAVQKSDGKKKKKKKKSKKQEGGMDVDL